MSSSSFAEISPSILFPPVCSDKDRMRNEKQPPPAHTHTHADRILIFSRLSRRRARKEGRKPQSPREFICNNNTVEVDTIDRRAGAL